jgi:hypothetical protein
MKTRRTKKTNRKIADRARVRLGSMSPAFPAPAPKKIADKGKVRLGSMSPAF